MDWGCRTPSCYASCRFPIIKGQAIAYLRPRYSVWAVRQAVAVARPRASAPEQAQVRHRRHHLTKCQWVLRLADATGNRGGSHQHCPRSHHCHLALVSLSANLDLASRDEKGLDCWMPWRILAWVGSAM